MNVRGLSTREKRQDTFHWLKSKKMSIYCLIDVHADIKTIFVLIGITNVYAVPTPQRVEGLRFYLAKILNIKYMRLKRIT